LDDLKIKEDDPTT